MARSLRINYAGAFYHVMNRGVERRRVFMDEEDYRAFTRLLCRLCQSLAVRVHAYCWMPNHYHAYVETREANLSVFMQQLEGRYAQRFNVRHQRVGPLFQGRFKSIIVDQDRYSLQLARYIHLNPVTAKLADRPEAYTWSSYRALLGLEKPESFHDPLWLLQQLGPHPAQARRALQELTSTGDEDGSWEPAARAAGGYILGEQGFVEWVKSTCLPKEPDRGVARFRQLGFGPSAQQVTQAVHGITDQPKLQQKLLVYALKHFTSLSLRAIGEQVGGMHPTAVSQVARRLELQRAHHRNIDQLLKSVEASICQM